MAAPTRELRKSSALSPSATSFSAFLALFPSPLLLLFLRQPSVSVSLALCLSPLSDTGNFVLAHLRSYTDATAGHRG